MSSSARKSGTRTPSSTMAGESSRYRLARPRRPRLAGRPLPSSRVGSMGAWCFSTCHAVRAPDFSICSAVIVNVPGGTSLFEPCWVAGPQPSNTTTNDAVSAFREASRFTSYSRVASEERQGIGRARPRVSCAAMLQLTALLLVAQIQVPPPRGYANDFAAVLDSASVAHMEAVIAEVRAKTRGEIAVVTLADIADRPAADVALEIGRRWGVGAKGEAGDPAKNLGVVVLLVPQKNHRPGTGQIFIATGRGAEGFLTDARVGRMRDAMASYLAREDYGAGLAYGVDLIAQAFAQEFGVTLSGVPPPEPDERGVPQFPVKWLIIALVLWIVLSRGRIFLLPFWFGGFGGGRGGWGGSSGGWGGGGGGGF